VIQVDGNQKTSVPCLSMIALAFAILFGGCNSSDDLILVPVSGVVLKNGVPVEGVSVVFTKNGLSVLASGKTDEKGQFKLSTFGNFDGAAVGDHIATVTLIDSDFTKFEKDFPMPNNSAIADPDERAKANAAAKNDRLSKLGKLAAEKKRRKPPTTIALKFSKKESSGLKFTVEKSTNFFQINVDS
jgi:hypothetical protein